MHRACVQRFDVMGSVEIILGTTPPFNLIDIIQLPSQAFLIRMPLNWIVKRGFSS